MAKALKTIHMRDADGRPVKYSKGFYVPDEIAATLNPKAVSMTEMSDVPSPSPVEVVGVGGISSEVAPTPTSDPDATLDTPSTPDTGTDGTDPHADPDDGTTSVSGDTGDDDDDDPNEDEDPLMGHTKKDLMILADAYDCVGLTDRDNKATIVAAIRENGYDGDGSEMEAS